MDVKPKKVVLLPTSTGQGHNSAASALKECLEERGCEAVILDVLKSGKKDVSSGVSRIYESITVHVPWFFRMLYNAGDRISSANHHSPVYYVNALNARALHEKLLSLHPDAVVCPHLFSGQTMTFIRKKYGYEVPVVGVMTDYTCSPFWEETRLDSYIIPAPELLDEFIHKGISRDKLLPLGIPVSKRYLNERDTAQARKKLGIVAQRVYLVMGGSMGYGSIPGIAAALHELEPDSLIIAVCGNNPTIFHKLECIPNIMPLRYANHVDQLMDAADVLLTKPGGLSSTEAAVKRVPIVFTCPIPGCESVNSDFFTSLGMGLTAQKPVEAARLAVELAHNPAAQERMRSAQQKHIPGYAARDISEYILRLVKGESQTEYSLPLRNGGEKESSC